MTPDPGTRLVFRWRKWDGSRHWEHECVFLGSDAHGEWVGQLAGWRSARPGREVDAPQPNVTLVPPSGEWAFTANAAPHPTRVYIDLGWDVRFDEAGEPTGVDMDLDVVEDSRFGIWIDDRDEWDEHRVHYGYPLDIVARLEGVAVELETRVRAREAPFDDVTVAHWLARLHSLATRPRGRRRGAA